MPRVKTDAERGYIGAWMRRERLSRDWSEDRVAQELAKRGRGVRPDYIRALEAGSGGKKPSPELRTELEAIFGSQAEPLAVAEPTDDPTLATLKELVEEVRKSRVASEQNGELVAQLLAVLVHETVGEEAWSRLQIAVASRAGPDTN